MTRDEIKARAELRKQLKAEIRELTQQVNLNIYEYRQTGRISKPVEAEIKRLQQFGNKANPIRNRGSEIGLGFKRARSIDDLKRQKAELERVAGRDVWMPSGVRKLNDHANKSWLSFKKRHPEYSKEDWQTFVDTFGAMSSELKEMFGYIEKRSGVEASDSYVGNDALVNAYSEGSAEKRVDIIKYMNEVIREHKNEGMTQKDAINYLKEKLQDDNLLGGGQGNANITMKGNND